ncbi:MAG TPA: L,D-transpeptidase [Solirubrobacteraceae bacterium]|nr:L,D-transpeptidase [Solirubrobacteraceae bacterium]
MEPRTAIAVLSALTMAMLAPAAAFAQDPAPQPTPAPTPEPPEAEQPLDIPAPSRTKGSTVARIVAPAFARAELGSRKRGWRVRTATAWSKQPQVLLVLDSATVDGKDWVKVLLADRPNGSAGWIPRDGVVLDRTRYWVTVRVRTRRVTVYRDGKRARSFRAVVGKPRTPTPLGLAAIYERNRQPDPGAFLGPWALSLTSLSNVLESFGGGPGRVAIHGRDAGSLRDPLGSARSHGCVRVDNGNVRWMAARVPVGTPVRVKR